MYTNFFFSSRRRHTSFDCDWSSDVCSSDLAMDKAHYIEVRKARGLVAILGERWDRLSAVPDQEIEAVQTVVGARLPVLPHAYLQEGQRVRIIRGPLADVQGILVRQDPRRGLLVLSVALLQQSVAVEVDCTDVVPT